MKKRWMINSVDFSKSTSGELNELALFAGVGGGILGGKLLGWRTVCAVEINAFCARRLMQRQNEGHLPPFPIWDDVSTFDGRPWKGCVDVVSAGFPCQDVSTAFVLPEQSGRGLDGERSGLWREARRIICEVRPKYLLLENSPALTFRGLGTVLGDLAEMGFNARWGCISAIDAGAHHRRERIWIVAYSDSVRFEYTPKHRTKQYTFIPSEVFDHCWDENISKSTEHGEIKYTDARNNERTFKPGIHRVLNGIPNRMDRLAAVGNAQSPAVVKLAWEILSQS